MKPCYLIICVAMLAYSGVCESFNSLKPVSLNDDMTSEAGYSAKDCADLQNQDFTESGVYTVFVGPFKKPVQVYCDQETNGGGWLVFQRRQDGYQDFYRGWSDYADGFGDLYGEFWLGNHVLHMLTNQKSYTLRIELTNHKGIGKVAKYSTFSIGAPVKNYRLKLKGYTGDAGDAMSSASGAAFTTKDQDNDSLPKNKSKPSAESNCARKFKGAWWYKNCHSSNLNGYYYGGDQRTQAGGINWKNYYYSYQQVQMKIKPAED